MGNGLSFADTVQRSRFESIEAVATVDPTFHLFGSVIILLLVYSVLQCSSGSMDAYVVVFFLVCNLICFLISTFCHWMSTSLRNPDLFFRLDYMGIVLHIWATSLSVLLLETGVYSLYGHGVLGLTVASFATAGCLLFLPLKKRIRIAIIGGIGSLTFLAVLMLVVASSRVSILGASYSFMVVINSVGGWHYIREIQSVQPSTTKPPPLKGHTLMHIYSVIGTMIHGLILVHFIRRRHC